MEGGKRIAPLLSYLPFKPPAKLIPRTGTHGGGPAKYHSKIAAKPVKIVSESVNNDLKISFSGQLQSLNRCYIV